MNTSSTGESQTPADSEPPVLAFCNCALCGAACESTQRLCWLCQSTIADNAGYTTNPYATLRPNGEVEEQIVTSKYDNIFTGLLIACFALAILIAIGMGMQDPGALIGFLILIGPAFAITGVRGLWQVGKTGRAQPKSLFISLAVSFAGTIAFIAILAVAAFLFMFAMCFYQLS